MSLLSFAPLAASVMVAAMAVVVAAARGAARLSPTVQSRLAVAALLGYGLVLVLRPSGWALTDTSVLAAAAGGALLLARRLPNPTSMLVFLAVAAVVDVVSSSWGINSYILEQYVGGQSELLLYLTVVMPLHGRIAPIVGAGDLFVGGAVAVVLLREDYRAGPVLGAVALGLVLALGYGLLAVLYSFWSGGFAAIPWMAVTVALLVWWEPTRRADAGPKDRLARDGW